MTAEEARVRGTHQALTPVVDVARVRGLLAAYVTDGLKSVPGEVTVGEKKRARRKIDEMDWDEAAQLYLSLAALSQELSSRGAKEAAAIRPDMLEIKARLKGAFPQLTINN